MPALPNQFAVRAAAPRAPVVDIANFFLIWLTLALALAWPFQLFLFSYIVIGPLHYLTEINWLEKQNYFLRQGDSRVFVWSMVVLVLLLTIGAVAPDMGNWRWTKSVHASIYNSPGNPLKEILTWTWSLMLVAFVTAAAWLFTENWIVRAGVIVFCLLCSFFFYTMPVAATLFGVLLPTIGHVFFFTILFMLYGTMKARSAWGYLNVISMFLVVAVIVLWPMTIKPGILDGSVIEMTIASAFQYVNLAISRWLHLTNGGQVDLYSPAFFKVQAFIAFAYTYHYLNWFSKTSIIKWHQVPGKKSVFSIVLWIASIALYKVDYRLGFAAISALSVLHIVLEFPLNFVSMRGIFGALMARLKTV